MRWWDVEGGVLALEGELFGADSWSAELFWSELADEGSRHYVVADVDDEVAGYAGLSAYGDEAYVQTIAVSPGYQRLGIGTQLLVDLLHEAHKRGAHTAGLEVRADNAVAQRLYARFGFEAVGVRRGYYQPSNIDAVVMIAEGIASSAYAMGLASRSGSVPRGR